MNSFYVKIILVHAEVAELADASDSKSEALKSVWVRVPSSAPNTKTPANAGVFCFIILSSDIKCSISYLSCL